MSQKKVKDYKRLFTRQQNRIWMESLKYFFSAIPPHRGFRRTIFCLRLACKADIVTFIQQQIIKSNPNLKQLDEV